MKKSIFMFNNQYIDTLHTERLILRQLDKKDSLDMYEYSCLEEVTRYLLWSPHENKNYTYRYLCQVQGYYKNGGYYDWAVVERATDKMIGTCGFANIDSDNNRGEIGYVLNPDFWGRGYAPEAVRAVLDYGFTYLGIHRAEAKYMVGNDRSRRVMEKCGMTFEGIQKDLMLVKGEYRDIGICSVIKEDFYKNINNI